MPLRSAQHVYLLGDCPGCAPPPCRSALPILLGVLSRCPVATVFLLAFLSPFIPAHPECGFLFFLGSPAPACSLAWGGLHRCKEGRRKGLLHAGTCVLLPDSVGYCGQEWNVGSSPDFSDEAAGSAPRALHVALRAEQLHGHCQALHCPQPRLGARLQEVPGQPLCAGHGCPGVQGLWRVSGDSAAAQPL